MLVFVHAAESGRPLRHLLANACRPLDGKLITLSYTEFLNWRRLPRGCYVFSDLDRLFDSTLALVRKRWADFEALDGDARCLNHPGRALTGRALMRRLASLGLTRQREIRADEEIGALRFPVFLRSDAGDARGLSPVLFNRRALDARLTRLLHEQGLSRCDIRITEFMDIRNERGEYESCSLLRIGDHYSPVTRSRRGGRPVWPLSRRTGEAGSVTQDRIAPETNAQESLLRPVFEAAGIEFGRAEYGFNEGQLVVLSMDTSPGLDTPELLSADARPPAAVVLSAYMAALAELGSPRTGRYYQALPDIPGAKRVADAEHAQRRSRRILRYCHALEYELRLRRLQDRWLGWRESASQVDQEARPAAREKQIRSGKLRPAAFSAPASHRPGA